jgi:hypothetical protein
MSVVPAELVPYSQMQQMAVTVAKSKLFGVENADQALALMALCQAEGIHPMTAVRDYHIIKGRPSLKSETMLARFIQAGGRVEWIQLSDKKAEATFSHPKGGTITLDWTIERGQTAGLANGDNWRKYPRAMLRSRLISEGVRTVYPSIVQGIYTPEELEAIPPEIPATVEGKIESFSKPVMVQSDVDVHMQAISGAQDLNALKNAFSVAHTAARKAGDAVRIGTFTLAYDARKDELAQPVIEQHEAPAEESAE